MIPFFFSSILSEPSFSWLAHRFLFFSHQFYQNVHFLKLKAEKEWFAYIGKRFPCPTSPDYSDCAESKYSSLERLIDIDELDLLKVHLKGFSVTPSL